jgi:uncharacterized protein (DUF1330 family)
MYCHARPALSSGDRVPFLGTCDIVSAARRHTTACAGAAGRSLMKKVHKLALAAMACVTGVAGSVAVQAQQAATAPAYLVVEVDIKDTATFQKYAATIPATIAPFGGRFVVRGGRTDALEGDAPKRIVMIAFDSMEKAQAWWNSPAYAEIRPIRHSAAVARLYFVEGVAPQ